MYGTTQGGGESPDDSGSVYELKRKPGGGWEESVTTLHFFSVYDEGIQPKSRVAVDAAGNLYGTTDSGGAYNFGAVYELIRPEEGGSWEEKTLHSFGHEHGGEAARLFGGVVFDGKGNLYGTTQAGGLFEGGRLFELTPKEDGQWDYTVLHDFGKTMDGSGPEGALIVDGAGNLYGTTTSGGTHGEGTVFEIIP